MTGAPSVGPLAQSQHFFSSTSGGGSDGTDGGGALAVPGSIATKAVSGNLAAEIAKLQHEIATLQDGIKELEMEKTQLKALLDGIWTSQYYQNK